MRQAATASAGTFEAAGVAGVLEHRFEGNWYKLETTEVDALALIDTYMERVAV